MEKDIRYNINACLFFRGNAGKHREAIWELKWIEKEKVQGDEETRAEIVVSVSTDGRITEWIIHKGLEYTGKVKFVVLILLLLSTRFNVTEKSHQTIRFEVSNS